MNLSIRVVIVYNEYIQRYIQGVLKMGGNVIYVLEKIRI